MANTITLPINSYSPAGYELTARRPAQLIIDQLQAEIQKLKNEMLADARSKAQSDYDDSAAQEYTYQNAGGDDCRAGGW